MREQLLGYLLEALEPAERDHVELQLGLDPKLRRELELLRRGLDPLRGGEREHCDPPEGLASRTCEFVARRAAVTLPPDDAAGAPGRWSLADLVVAAGVFLAAAMLFFPALNHSRFAARLTSCQNNLRQLGLALSQYNLTHAGFFPEVEQEGNFAVAGIYAPRLVHNGYLTDPQTLVCPSSPLADGAEPFRVPTFAELRGAQGKRLADLHHSMGGSYGYTLGYVANDEYHTTRNLHRPTFAVMADAPNPQTQIHQSLNHGGNGQNVLFEDGHVLYLTTCTTCDRLDDIFVNDGGHVAAGLHHNDAVIGNSSARPLIVPVGLQR